MILNTDKKETSLKGVYIFYSAVITICILALFVFDLNIYAKAVLCALILLCVLVMRSLKHALPIPPDFDTEPMEKTEETSSKETVSTVEHGGAIDTYLTLLIETDEELKNDPSVDTSSPSYTNLLNERIGMKLDAMSKRNNHSDNN
jgi:hypothetical protein